MPSSGLKGEIIKRLMEADPDGAWLDESGPSRADGDEREDDQLGLERDKNELLRQELELAKRERDLAQREAALMRRELELATRGNEENPAISHREGESEGQFQQRVELRATPQLRTDVKGIGDLLGEFDGSNRYFEEWEKQVRLVKRLFTVDDAIMKIVISSKLKGKSDRWFRSKSEYTEMTLDELLLAMKNGFD